MAIVASLAELEAIYGEVNPNSLTKEVPVITAEYRALIEASPFVSLATVGSGDAGGMDCSPRGDKGSVVTVVDERTLHLPDRRGNNRIDSLRNIVEDGRVALLFLLPGITECVRVNGTAVLRSDEAIRTIYAVDDKLPATVIEITAQTIYFQCARAVKRSAIWDPTTHLDRNDLPTPGKIMTAITEGGFDGATYDDELDARQAATLY